MANSSTTDIGADTPRRLGARDKRKQVIDAAVEIFLMNGFDQTSMDAIAARAGVSKTTVYAHYPDKLALFKAVVERAAQSLAVEPNKERVEAAGTAESRLTQLIASVLVATTQPDFRAFMRVMVSESARHPDLAEAMRASARVDVVRLISDILEEHAASCGYRLEEPQSYATLLLRMAASGPQLDSLLFASFKPDLSLLDVHARWVVAIFLRGIEPRNGASATVSWPFESYRYPWLPDTIKPPSSTRKPPSRRRPG